MDFQLPPKILYGVEIWRLARPLQDLEMVLMKSLLRCLAGVFGLMVMLKDPATFHLQCPCWWKEVFTQNIMIHGPIHSFFYMDQLSWSLCRKTAPKYDVSTPMLHSRYGVLWMQLSILFPPDTRSWVWSSKCSLANLSPSEVCLRAFEWSRWGLGECHMVRWNQNRTFW